MALTKDDLKQIGQVVVAVTSPMFEDIIVRIDGVENRLDGVEGRLEKVEGRLEKVENSLDSFKNETHHRLSALEKSSEIIERKIDMLDEDVKSLYKLIDRIEKTQTGDKKFLQLDLEQKVLRLYRELQATAKQAGISLPR